jgi:hypothetical protein
MSKDKNVDDRWCMSCSTYKAKDEFIYETNTNKSNTRESLFRRKCQECYETETGIKMETGADWVKRTEESMKDKQGDWYTGGDYYQIHNTHI